MRLCFCCCHFKLFYVELVNVGIVFTAVLTLLLYQPAFSLELFNCTPHSVFTFRANLALDGRDSRPGNAFVIAVICKTGHYRYFRDDQAFECAAFPD